jgi:hypothetical protein
MRKTLLQAYQDLKESGSTSDFPYLLANLQHKALLRVFKGVNSPWRSYVKIGDLADFKTHDRVILGESPDLLEVAEGGSYQDHAIGESRYQIRAKTYGRTWSVTRQAVINDDLQGLTDVAGRFGRATARTMVKQIVAVLEANAAAYDGTALFAARGSWTNDGHTAITANVTGIQTLDTAMRTLKTATDPHTGEKLGIGSKFWLIVPPALEVTAKWLKTATEVRGGSTSTLTSNPMQGAFDVLVEPFLSFSGRSYLCVDPSELHFAEVGFLNGKEDPDVLVKNATASRVAGGEDPWGYDFDELEYKVRHDWAVAAGFYQAVYKLGD